MISKHLPPPCWKNWHDFHAGLCWLVLVWCWFSKVPLIMLAYQHSLAGEVAEEAGHQNPMHQHWKFPVENTCACILFNQHLDYPHLSGGWLILLDFNKHVLKIWKE